MANTNTPFGLALSRSQDGENSGVVKNCYIPSTNANKLYVGDAVVISGSNTAVYGEYGIGTLPTIAKAAASGGIDGVIVGFLPTGEFESAGAYPASKEGIALVSTNPMAKFNIQATGTVSAADVGKYADISTATAGNDYSGISGMALDHSTIDADDTLPLKIVGIADYLNNEAGEYAVVEVKLNK